MIHNLQIDQSKFEHSYTKIAKKSQKLAWRFKHQARESKSNTDFKNNETTTEQRNLPNLTPLLLQVVNLICHCEQTQCRHTNHSIVSKLTKKKNYIFYLPIFEAGIPNILYWKSFTLKNIKFNKQ